MTALDYFVMIGSSLAIILYGMWRTRKSSGLNAYLRGDDSIRWGTIGLSVMATQASAITFLSTPGQAYESGMGFVQNYFGMPFAIIVICVFFIPIYRRLNVITAYEYLGQRFDAKTRSLGAFLFLVQRGLAAGITIYAPAIIVSTILGWNLDLTIVAVGVLVIVYTVSGGTKAVSITQRYQMAIIFVGMVIAFAMIVRGLPDNVSFGQAVAVAGKMGKLEAVDFSFDIDKRYTFWSGLLGGFFLSLSYFGTDQSQVQRYLAGTSMTASRVGLLFNAVVKIPMQFFILFVGVMVFVFYQFEKPPMFFNQATLDAAAQTERGGDLARLESEYDAAAERRSQSAVALSAALGSGEDREIEAAKIDAMHWEARSMEIRGEAKRVISEALPGAETKDADYVFISFVLNYLPHGVIGLLIAVIFAAAMSSIASELNALGSTTTIDFYVRYRDGEVSDAHKLAMSRLLTAAWGCVAIAFAFFAKLTENLIEWVNILGSIFYGVILGIFLVAFFVRFVRGTAVFFAALISQALVIVLFFALRDAIGYLWFNLIGCASVIFIAMALQAFAPRASRS